MKRGRFGRHISQDFDSPVDPPINSPFAFVVGLYDDILKSGVWSDEPFTFSEDEWPPSMCIKDPISGDYFVYHKGEIRASTKKECEGFETAAVWDVDHVIDRIMGARKEMS